MSFAPGLHVGRYEVLTKLGQGGFGIIYVGRDTELDRDVALKFLRPEHVTRPDVVMRFLQEARAAAKINHPGIVTVFECGQVTNTNTRADGTVYIAMELLAGESLAQRLKRERLLPPAIALGITRQLCSALQAAHVAGIVHRDLKPDNIFLVPDLAMRDGIRVKILDFGVAKLADGQFGPSGGVRTHSAMVLGTPTYMSPEQCRSSAKVDHRSDIYAVGCILYELLCGARPYDGDAGEQIAKHQLAPVPVARTVNPAIPAELDALVSQMLAKTPDERPGSMEFVDEALATFERAPTQPVLPARSPSNLPAPPPTAMAMFEAENAPTKVTAAGPSRRSLAAGAAGVIVLGVLLGVVCTRASSSSEQTTAATPPPADAAAVAVVAPDAAVVIPVAATPDAAPPSTDDVKIECLKLAADKKWRELMACTDRLASADPVTATSLRTKAVTENNAETFARKLADALAANELEQAKLELDRIPSDSVYRAEAKAAYEAKVSSVAADVAEQARALAADHKCAELDRLVAKAHRDGTDTKLGNPRCKPETAAISTATTTNGSNTTQTPPPACDADALRNKAQDYLSTGMDAAALASFEASMRCRADSSLIRFAFMAACRSRNAAKARYYYAKIPPGTVTSIIQICVRNGIVLP